MRGQYPSPQFRDRRVWTSGDLRADSIMQIRQLRSHMTALRQRRRLTGQPTPAEHLGDIGDADAQQDGNLANPIAVIRRSQNTLPQIL